MALFLGLSNLDIVVMVWNKIIGVFSPFIYAFALAFILNRPVMWFEKKVFTCEKGKASFIALAKAYFQGGGQQYTVTVVSPEDLIDAKENPENHRNLIVRVGGYSDYFTSLSKELQDNVIERTFVDT